MSVHVTRLTILAGLLGGNGSGCGGNPGSTPPAGLDGGGDGDADADSDGDSDADSDGDAFDLRQIDPDHGTAAGGTIVELRGSGLAAGVQVRFGGRPATGVEVLDETRVQVTTPAGEPGPVEVEVERTSDGRRASRQDGYTYDVFAVAPGRGSIAGGTLVSVAGSGTRFEPGDSVLFDGVPATGVEVVSTTRIDCRTPPGELGSADVRIGGLEVEDAFEYYNPASAGGGLSGGPIAGTLNVTVVSAGTGSPISEAFVMLGSDGSSYQGETDGNGQITFSGDDLSGRQTITAAKNGFAPSTFVGFDATDVTIRIEPTDGDGEEPRRRLAADIRGELLFFSDVEVGWSSIPDPIGDEIKIAYVETSRPDIATRPVPGGEESVVREDGRRGDQGWEFEIYARPGAFAVFAIAGLLDTGTGEFSPYLMGIARNVLAGPGDEIEELFIDVSIPLDRQVVVALQDPPEGDDAPPHARAGAALSLGGEGVIVGADWIDRSPVQDELSLPWLPALEGSLSDASLLVVAGLHAGEPQPEWLDELDPFTWRIQGGIADLDAAVEIGEFLGVPRAVMPEDAGEVAGGALAWAVDGGATPTFQHLVLQTLGDAPVPIWDIVARGDVDQLVLPDLPAIHGLPAPPPGLATWLIHRHEIGGVGFDEFRYEHESLGLARAYARDSFLIAFPRLP